MSRAYWVNLIIDYYDSIVKTLDVYTEQLLETIDPNKLADEASIGEIITKGKQPVFSGFEKYLISVEPKYTPGVTKLVDYVNSIRQEMIDRVNKCQQDTLDFYHENRKEFEIDPKQMDTHKREELKKQLFGKSFCFVLSTKGMERFQIDNNLDKKCLFEMYLIVFDHYLDKDAIDYIRNIFGTAEYIEFSPDRQEKLFSDTRVLVYSSIYYYILDCWLFQRGHQHSIDIRLDQIMAEKDLRLVLKSCGESCPIDLSKSKDIDFSSLTDLKIILEIWFSDRCNIKIKSFGIFPNLTNLSLLNFDFKNDLAFENLANIRHLNLKDVRFVGSCEFRIHKRMPNLKVLCLDKTRFEDGAKLVGFSKLELLEKLELKNLNYRFDFDAFPNSHLTHLKIENCVNMREFPFALLPNLKHYEIKNFNSPTFDDKFKFDFQCESKLETLVLQNIYYFSIRSHLVKQFSKLTKLARLDIIACFVSPEKGFFQNLPSLKCLSLRDNCIEELEDGVFMGLENLEELDLRGNQLGETSLRQLDGLKSLKEVKLDPRATL